MMTKQGSIKVIVIGAGVCLLALVIMLRSDRHNPLPVPAAVEARPLDPASRIALSSEETGSIRDELAEALGRRTGIANRQRLHILENFAGELSQLEAEVLADEILRPLRPDEELAWSAEYFHSICCILRNEKNFRERFAGILATVIADASRDQSIRDYAIQHLGTLWETSPASGDLRASVLATFQQVIRDHKSSAAASLLSLHLLGSGFNQNRPMDQGSRNFHVSNGEVLPIVETALKNRTYSNDAAGLKMAALRVVADRRMSTLLPSVREIARGESSEHPLVRMAAISTLGQMGDPGDRPLLESLTQEDPRIAGAVRRALELLPGT